MIKPLNPRVDIGEAEYLEATLAFMAAEGIRPSKENLQTLAVLKQFNNCGDTLQTRSFIDHAAGLSSSKRQS